MKSVPRKLAACQGCPTPTGPDSHPYLLRRGERLILEVRMSSLDHACDAVDLVTAAVSTVRFVEHSVFVEDLIDRCASTHGSISPNTSWRLRSNKVDTVGTRWAADRARSVRVWLKEHNVTDRDADGNACDERRED
jgi:hypothetical protein